MTLFLALVLKAVARLLQAASVADDLVREETGLFPEGATVAISVLPDGPAAYLMKRNMRFTVIGKDEAAAPSLEILFASPRHAFAVFTLREDPMRAFASRHCRFRGESFLAAALMRCLFHIQDLFVPRWLNPSPARPLPFRLRLAEAWPILRHALSGK